jgi:hypothetical protein
MVEPWVRWFAEAMERSAEDSSLVMGLIENIQAAWREQAKDLRSDSAGRKLVERLPSLPVVSAAMNELKRISANQKRTSPGQRGSGQTEVRIRAQPQRPVPEVAHLAPEESAT